MTVIPFSRKEGQAVDGWHTSELTELVEGFASELRSGEASAWDTGMTEAGDPQFYLIGPPPDQDCILCVSRLGRLYVLEDGAGRPLFETIDIELLQQQAKALFSRSKSRLLAQIALTLGALRHAFEEKIEPILLEAEDMLAHVAPQLAAFA